MALHRKESIKNTFISGQQSFLIGPQLLKNTILDLIAMLDQEKGLDST